MFTSASTSRVMLPASRSRQHSVLSQASDMASAADEGQEEVGAINGQMTTSSSRRKVNRSNPQMSYAYGAPTDGRQPVKKPRLSKETSQGIGVESTSPPPPPVPTIDAATRYKAVREKQQQRKQTPAAKRTITSVDSPRRSARLSTNGSQDATTKLERQEAIDAIEEDQSVEDEEEEDKFASLSLARRRSRIASPGQSRSVNANLSSFYLDAGKGDTHDVKNGMPNPLLRGAQRLSQTITSPDVNGLGMSSIRSSDFGDSNSHDYEEEERYATMLDQRAPGAISSLASAIFRSPKSLLKSSFALNGKGSNHLADISLEKKNKKKGRISADNQVYRPAEEDEESEEMSDVSEGGHKHGHRRRKIDSKATARGGRDDHKIWKTTSRKKGGRRISGEGEGEETINAEEGEEVVKEQGPSTDAYQKTEREIRVELMPHIRAGLNRIQRHVNEVRSFKPSIPPWAVALAILLLMASLGFQAQRRSTSSTNYDSIPGFTSSSSLAANSISEVSKRIQALENSFEALRVAGANAAKDGKSLALRLANLEDEKRTSFKRLATSQEGLQEQMKEVRLSSVRLEKELNDLDAKLERMHSRLASEGKESNTLLKRRIDELQAQLKQNDKLMSQISERATLAERVALQTKQSLQWLEKKLPVEIAVPVEKGTGKPTLDASAWDDLRKFFIARNDVEFERKNEETIRIISMEQFNNQMQSGAILTRENFLKLLKEELEQVKVGLESQFNVNAGEIQADILAKIRAQQDMYEKAGSWTKDRSKHKASTLTIDAEDVDILTKDGSSAKEAILTLIEGALEVYSADRIAKRDFALYSAGARVIPSLTSPTYKLQRPSFFSWKRSSSGEQDTARPPVVALHHDSTPGMCWAFEGEDGQLGIGLARKVIVSDVTLEHVAASISLEAGTSAPRDVTVWGLVERQSDRNRLLAYRQSIARSDDSTLSSDSPTPAPPSSNHLLLASFTYDVHSSRAIQTFPVSLEAKTLQIPVSIAQVRITSNHGNKDFTCLYRIRVHGQEWTWENEQQSAT